MLALKYELFGKVLTMQFLIFVISLISGMSSTAWSGTIVDIKSGTFNSLIVIYLVDN